MKYPRFSMPMFLTVLASIILTSCVSRKEIVYFQGLDKAENHLNKNINSSLNIKPNDLLTISVSATEQEAALPFNLPVVGVRQGGAELGGLSVNGRQQLQTYLVDSEGNIQFPVLGTVEVAGLTRQALSAKLKGEITEYVQNPIVNVRLVNFQVSVLGEVNMPGTFDIRDEYLSLPKALGFAGDRTS